MDSILTLSDEFTVAIPVRSRRQAEDWSLVLVSQGIEPRLRTPPESDRIELRIPVSAAARARTVLAQYERENRHRRWQQPWRHPGLVFDWQCVGWGLLLVIVHVLSILERSGLRPAGEFVAERVRAGEWWRAFTALWLHADIPHVTSNLTTGLVFLGVAMAEYGAGTALAGMTLAGGAANAIGLALRPGPFTGLGASGAVMAALGMIAVRAFRYTEWQEHPGATAWRSLMAGIFLLILVGFSPESDVLVHVAGFLCGALLGLVLRPVALKTSRQADWDLPSKLAFLAMVAWPWWRALQ